MKTFRVAEKLPRVRDSADVKLHRVGVQSDLVQNGYWDGFAIIGERKIDFYSRGKTSRVIESPFHIMNSILPTKS